MALVTSGLVMRVEADSGVTFSSGTSVSQWDDLSGNGNHLIVGGGTPTLNASSTPSGAPSIAFDGVDDYLNRENSTAVITGLPTAAADRTIFMLVRFTAAGTFSGFTYGTPTTNQVFGLVTSNQNGARFVVQAYGANDLSTTTELQTAGWKVLSARVSANTAKAYVDNVQVASAARTYATDYAAANGRIRIGREIGTGGYATMNMAAGLIYNRALTDQEMADTTAYLTQKYIAPATSATITSQGVAWTINSEPATGTYAGGRKWVQGAVSVTAISPAPALEGGLKINGAMLGVTPGNSLQGFDERMQAAFDYDNTLNAAATLPIAVPTASVLISARSYTAAERTSLGHDGGDDPFLAEHQILHTVVTPPAAGAFAPSYFTPATPSGVTLADIDATRLPNLKMPNAAAYAPNWTLVQSFFNFPRVWFSGAYIDRYMHADLAYPHPLGVGATPGTYGREIATAIETACLSLLLDHPVAQKTALLEKIVQYAIDMCGFFQQGGTYHADGGHNMGRKLVMLIAAKVTGLTKFSQWLDASLNKFQEDQQCFFVDQADVDLTNSVSWNPDSRDIPDDAFPYVASDIGRADWGLRDSTDPARNNKHFNSMYRGIASPSMTGLALAIRLLGMEAQCNSPDLLAYVDWYRRTNQFGTFSRDMYEAYRHIGAVA
ncbi:LamG-like jellyroll fold domain-containing protein [Allohahella sp. A8]|uniref:LamG-like jellyroll fold domain-containing protein n=1 Tax=Allohahella sp. A8 TaxID=3141461 RepID=UPI003A80C331